TMRCQRRPRALHSFPTRRSSDLHTIAECLQFVGINAQRLGCRGNVVRGGYGTNNGAVLTCSVLLLDLRQCILCGLRGRTLEAARSEEHTSELQSRENLVCRLLLE